MVRSKHFVSAAVLIPLDFSHIVRWLEEDAISVGRTLIVFIDVYVVLLSIAFVGWVESDRHFIIIRKSFFQDSGIVALIKSLDLILRFKYILDIIIVWALESKICITHNPVVLGGRVAFKFVLLFGGEDFPQDACHHVASRLQFIGSADQMHIDKTKNFVEELELEQEPAFVTYYSQHTLSQVVNYWSAMKKI